MNNKEELQIRTCVITRVKEKKERLIRLAYIKNENKYYFDEKQKMQTRSIYIKPDYDVLDKLSKNKRYNIDSEELLKILNYIKTNTKEKKDDILEKTMKTMNYSKYLVFGIEDCVEGIKSKRIKLMILPQNIRENYKNRFEKLCSLNNVEIVHIKKQSLLSKIFSKNVNVVGITNKQVAYGLIKKLEG